MVMHTRRLEAAVLAALGLTLVPGCSERKAGSGKDEHGTTDSSPGPSPAPTPGPETEGQETEGQQTEGEETQEPPPIFDVFTEPTPEPPTDPCDPYYWTDECEWISDWSAVACTFLPEGLDECEQCEPNCLVVNAENEPDGFIEDLVCEMGVFEPYHEIICGPFEIQETCCYLVEELLPPPGRPFLVDGHARLAQFTPGGPGPSDWCARIEPNTELPTQVRSKLAELWLEDAAMEHASIATFARFALQLIQLGAPAKLLSAAQRAAADEVEHARACLALACAYAGRDWRPGPMDLRGSLAEPVDLVALVQELVSDGCVGECLAALQAAVAADFASDPVVRSVLRQIAEDEQRHGQLAWRSLRWILEQHDDDGALAVVAARSFAEARAASRWIQAHDGFTDHGRLSATALRELHEHAFETVLLPCARALLSGSAPTIVSWVARAEA